MTRYTVKMNWPFPDEYADPYIGDADDEIEAQDVDAAVTYEDGALFVQFDGSFDYDIGLEKLTWDSAIYIHSPRGGGKLQISANNIVFSTDPAFLYVEIPSRFLTSTQVVTMQQANSAFGITNKNRIIVGYREGTKVFMRRGFLGTHSVGIDHADLGNVLGAGQYHLSEAQRDDLTDGGNSSGHKHDDRYYTETEISSTGAGTEGASLVGTQGLTNLGTPANVQAALEAVNTKNPPARKTYAGNPNGNISGSVGDFCIDTDNDDIYINTTGSNVWICLT